MYSVILCYSHRLTLRCASQSGAITVKSNRKRSISQHTLPIVFQFYYVLVHNAYHIVLVCFMNHLSSPEW